MWLARFRFGFKPLCGRLRSPPSQSWRGMALALGVGLGALWAPLAGREASAQVGGLYWQCVAPSGGTPAGYCQVSTTYPLPVNGSASGAEITAVAGTQRALAISSATALTVPATATIALIQAQGSNNGSGVCLYWQDDGTVPTVSAGQILSAGTSMYYAVVGLPIKLIAATGATCTATISYFK